MSLPCPGQPPWQLSVELLTSGSGSKGPQQLQSWKHYVRHSLAPAFQPGTHVIPHSANI